MSGKPRPIRRIVTGHDVDGKSIIASDAPSPHVLVVGAGGPGCTDLWKTFGTPADNSGREDPCGQPITLAPPKNGSVFRVVEFPPDKDYLDRWKPEDAFATMGESGAKAIDRSSGAKHAGMHKTQSVDYAFVLDGEIWAVMDKGEVLMRAGDMLVQRGTNHAWSNRSDRPALVGFVLIDAKPL